MKKYIIGVDGGGTKTEAVAYDLDGGALATGYSGHGNLLIDGKKAVDHITDAIKQCFTLLGREGCVYIYLGLAGIESGTHRDDLEQALSRFSLPFAISNDAQIAHAALLKGKDGILTISGTGAVSYGTYAGRLEIGGGWGHLLGDEGSGYWIAIEAFKKMIFDYDNGKPISRLSRNLLQALELVHVPDVKRFIYSKAKGEIAAVVPLIVSMADDGEQVAQNILTEAGRHLAKMTIALHDKLQWGGEPLIAIKGSVLTRISWVKESFVTKINSKIKGAIVIDEELSATKGAYYLALKQLKETC